MNKIKILISDKISVQGIDILKDKFSVDIITGLSEEELVSSIPKYNALIVRSETQVTAKVIKAANNLKVIGRAGVGVDNIDMQAATSKGISVVNTPNANTSSTAELTLALLLDVARKVSLSHISLQSGEWNRSAFLGTELNGKTLGVIGLGKIGKRVASYANCLGMKVLACDPYISEEEMQKESISFQTIDELLSNSDFITIHVPKTEDTIGLINAENITKMKDGVCLVNCSRGGIVEEEDLKHAVESGKIAIAATDVYSEEPVNGTNPLIGVKNIITTPHIGAATKDAKINVSIEVATQVSLILEGKEASSIVNNI